MKFNEFEAEFRRLLLLQGLANAAKYIAHAALLRMYCEAVGHTTTADRVETDLTWLSEQGLVDTKRVGENTVATLTVRGLDVAQGAATVPGVQRPKPGAF